METREKRICMIALAYYPLDSRIRREAEALESAGYEVDILCGSMGKQPKVESFGNITAYRIMNLPPQENPRAYMLQSLLFIILAFFRLQVLAIKKKYRLIQTHNLPDYLIFASVIQKLFGVKLLLDIHDPSVELFEEKWPGKKNRILLRLVRIAERLSCNLSNHLITVTNECKNRLVSRGNPAGKISIIMNTADESTFSFNKEREFRKITEKVKILYHGTVAKRFGLHNAIEAMEYLLKDIPGSVFNIYGIYEKSYRIKIEKLVKKLKLENSVTLNDKVSMEQIPGLINTHDIGIVPYLKTGFMNLALPTKAFEYIASGLPVVSTKTYELVNTFDEKCITYADDSKPEEIAEAIKKLCLNPEVAKQQVVLAYQALSKISGSIMKKRYVELIDDIIYDRSPS